MATYQFSALSDGQAISFNPNSDVLNFDQTAIAAADVVALADGANLRITVGDKDVVLLNVVPFQVTTSNITFANGSRLLFGDNSTGTANDNLANSITASTGRDHVAGFGGNDTLFGAAGNDVIEGGAGNDSIGGNDGNDWLEGGTGNDTLSGGSGQDSFVFRAAGSTNADLMSDFASGWDSVRLDAAAFANAGPAGRFAAGDARFYAAAGATAGHDADDRVIFNTATGQLFYDADGNGSGAAQLVATLPAGRTVVASDIWIFGTSSSGGAINGTAGNDSLVGTAGNDTINGFGGDDTLVGGEGVDVLNGGDGNDKLNGENSRFGSTDSDVETMDGGLGNDTFIVDNPVDVLSDTGGVDTVVAINTSWTLAAGFENLVINNGELESRVDGIGNELDNVLDGSSTNVLVTGGDGWFVYLEGRGGNDTLLGSVQNDTLLGGDGNDVIASGEDVDTVDGGAGDDTLDGGIFGDDDLTGGSGADHFVLAAPGNFPNRITDFASGTDKLRLDGNRFENVGVSGNFSAGDERFFAGTAAHDASDRVIWDGSSLWYDADGTGAIPMERIAMLQADATVVATDIEVVNGTTPPPSGNINGTEGSDRLFGTTGSDTIYGYGGNDYIQAGAGADTVIGGAGNDTIGGNDGADWLEGGLGNDSVNGGSGQDQFVFREFGTANADSVSSFAAAWDHIRVDDAAFTAIGALGRFSSGDARFYAAAGASAGHDGDDRMIYNTTTGQLYYDADGNGSGAAQIVATIGGAPALAATDITVI